MGTRSAARVAGAAAVVDLVLLVILTLTPSGVDKRTEPMSAHVHDGPGILIPTSAAVVGVGALALLAAVRPLVAGRPARLGLVLLGVFGVAKVVQAFFPIDDAAVGDHGAATAVGAVHSGLGNLAFFTLPIAAVLLSPPLARTLGASVTGARVLSWILVAAAAVVMIGDAAGFFGIAQRLYLAYASIWILVTASWLLRAPRSAASVPLSP